MTRLVLLLALVLGLGCRSSSTVPEPGAVLLQLGCADGVSAPDELRVWAYHDGGMLWDGMRIPEHGALDSTNPAKLGTVLIAPGTIQGALRIHVRAYAAGQRVAEGIISIASLSDAHGTHDLHLESAVPADRDRDGVPDAIDDCPDVGNPGQGGCAAVPSYDAGFGMADGPRPADGVTGSPDPEDARPGADGSTTVMADAEIQTADARDVPVDAPVTTSVDSSTKVDVGIQTIPDGRGADADSSIPVDLAVDKTVLPDAHAPVDLAVPVDGVALDGTSSALDGDRDDAHEEDTCGINCKKTQGEPCARDEECASTFCADGVCCTNACSGPCRSCNQPNATGSCHGYAAGTDPEGECVEGAKCNGVGACGAAPRHDKANGQLCESGAECASGICKDDVCCNETCNLPCQTCGTGTCESIRSADDIPECTGSKTCNGGGKCVPRSG